jgi:GDP-L-fucose synthase
MPQGRKILVAGGTGLVGANLVPLLHRQGAQVHATFLSHQPPGLPELYSPADFTDPPTALRLTTGMDDLVICAAYSTGIEDMRKNPTAGILPNLLITANLLEAARVNKLQRVIVLSSSTVYQPADHPIREEELDLNQPPHEAYLAIGNVYRFLEQLCQVYRQQFGLRISILRPSSIYGPHDHFEPGRSHVLPALIRRALQKETPFRVWGSPTVVRDFVFVADVVDAIVQILDHDCPGPLNIGLGQGVTVSEAVQTILDLCDHPAPIEYDVRQPSAIPYRVLDTSKYAALFGNPAKTSLVEGLRQTIAWYRKQGEKHG